MKKTVKIVALLLLICSVTFCVTTVTRPQRIETAYALTLKQGSRGETVKKMQQKLKNWGYYFGSVDGIYGKKTLEAVKYFQRKNKLVVDGIAGPKTLSAMGISSGGSTSNYSSQDIALLARLIYGEARGESYVGQVAVGAVVLNRIKSPSFPNTMSGVIYQKYALLQ